MNKAKKLASLLLALVMALALAAPAFATEGEKEEENTPTAATGSITIGNAKYSETYDIYRIFDLLSYDVESDAYFYTVNKEWKDFIDSEDGKKYVQINTPGDYVTWVETTVKDEATGEEKVVKADAAEFAKLAIAYAKEHHLKPSDTKTTGAKPEGSTDEATTVEFTGLELGYYLVDSNTGALCSLNTTNPHADITDKNSLPTIDKKVWEATNEEKGEGRWDETSDTDIGKTVKYQVTIPIVAGAEDYIMHDTMSTGLTFDATSVVITVGSDETPVVAGDETYSVITEPEDDCTFEVVFVQSWLTANEGKDIVVSYSATLNADAVVANKTGDSGAGNTNTVQLEYGNDQWTDKKTTHTYTYEFDLVKTDGEDVLLSGAEFVLYREQMTIDAAGNEMTFYDRVAVVGFDSERSGETGGREDNWYVYQMGGDGKLTSITVSDGKIIIRGLDQGTYYLEETKAPNGYNKLADPIKVEIKATVADDKTAQVGIASGAITDTLDPTGTAHATIKNEGKVYQNGGVRVVNLTGAQLPSTGGIGTTIFYIVGGVLAAGAVILLITKRRMNIDK